MTDSMQTMRCHVAWRRLALSGLVLAAPLALAQPPSDIYVSTGEHGEVSFSDVAAPGAERLEIEASEPSGDPRAEMERRIEQTLSVANALEESRLAREKARAEGRARAAAARVQPQPQVVYPDRYAAYPRGQIDTFSHSYGQFPHKRAHRRYDEWGWYGHQRDRRHDGRHHRDGRRGHDGRKGDRGSRTISKSFSYDPD